MRKGGRRSFKKKGSKKGGKSLKTYRMSRGGIRL